MEATTCKYLEVAHLPLKEIKLSLGIHLTAIIRMAHSFKEKIGPSFFSRSWAPYDFDCSTSKLYC